MTLSHQENVPFVEKASFFVSWLVAAIFGCVTHSYEFMMEYLNPDPQSIISAPKGYATIIPTNEYFFFKRMYWRIRDLWERPVCSAPEAMVEVMLRDGSQDFKGNVGNQTLNLTKDTILSFNLASYNYLGFADGVCNEDVIKAVRKYGLGTSSSKQEVGNCDVHRNLERKFAKFIGQEDCLLHGMGYATNSTTIPALCGPGSLIISDSLNHASIVAGCRSSGATIQVFPHNNMITLEKVIREALRKGQPRTGRNWKKIIIVVEGIYSMEGEILRLKELVALKKKYKCYLYIDEAHSIGALGPRAKGVCDYYGVNPKEVDVLMGTFTKSFGSVGGYISGNKDLITYLRQSSYGPVYATSMPPPCAQQIASALRIITGEDGTDQGMKRIRSLRENSNYFRRRLTEMGFRVVGDLNSPVVPMMLYQPLKMAEFSREILRRGVAVVVLGPPVTSWYGTRARFCISASHTKEQLDKALEKIGELGDLLMVRFDDKYRERNLEMLMKEHALLSGDHPNDVDTHVELVAKEKEPVKLQQKEKEKEKENEIKKKNGLHLPNGIKGTEKHEREGKKLL